MTAEKQTDPTLEVSDDAILNRDGRNIYCHSLANGGLHNQKGPAVKFGEGTENYYLNGICLTKERWAQAVKEKVLPSIEGCFIVWRNKYGDIHADGFPAFEPQAKAVYDTRDVWYKNGKIHRYDGPAYTRAGQDVYVFNGEEITKEVWEIARSEGIVCDRRYADSDLCWTRLLDGAVHATKWPAIISFDGKHQKWMQNGRHHRLDGPAKISENTQEYAINGNNITKLELEAIRSCGIAYRCDSPPYTFNMKGVKVNINDAQLDSQKYIELCNISPELVSSGKIELLYTRLIRFLIEENNKNKSLKSQYVISLIMRLAYSENYENILNLIEELDSWSYTNDAYTYDEKAKKISSKLMKLLNNEEKPVGTKPKIPYNHIYREISGGYEILENEKLNNRYGPARVVDGEAAYYLNGINISHTRWENAILDSVYPFQETYGDTVYTYWRRLDSKLFHSAYYPAIYGSDGSEEWFLNGKRHRDQLPAYICPDVESQYWQWGFRKNSDGTDWVPKEEELPATSPSLKEDTVQGSAPLPIELCNTGETIKSEAEVTTIPSYSREVISTKESTIPSVLPIASAIAVFAACLLTKKKDNKISVKTKVLARSKV